MNLIQNKIKTFNFNDIIENEYVSICLFRNVSNSKQLLEYLLDKNSDIHNKMIENSKNKYFLLLNAKMVYNIEHILISVSTCLLREKIGTKKRTKTFETEVLYNMSPSTNISYSLKKFGINEDTKDIICLFINIDQEQIINFLKLVEGDIFDIEELSQVHDICEIKKMINFSKNSQQNINIDDILRGLISIKDI